MAGAMPDALKHSVVRQPRNAPANAMIGGSPRIVSDEWPAAGVAGTTKADCSSSRLRRRASAAVENKLRRLAGSTRSLPGPESRCQAVIIFPILLDIDARVLGI